LSIVVGKKGSTNRDDVCVTRFTSVRAQGWLANNRFV